MTIIDTKTGTTFAHVDDSEVRALMSAEHSYIEAMEDVLSEYRDECETLAILDFMTAEEIAAALRIGAGWNFELAAALCDLADMDDEWASAGEDFEAVVEAAADKLGVEIY